MKRLRKGYVVTVSLPNYDIQETYIKSPNLTESYLKRKYRETYHISDDCIIVKEKYIIV